MPSSSAERGQQGATTETGEVIIVGAGPVGMITALGLARAGIGVRILEANAGIVPEPRAMTYHWTVHEGMQRLGLLDDMIAEGFKLHQMCYRILATGEVIRLDIGAMEGHTAHPYAVVLGQDQLEAIVLRHLARMPNVRIDWNTTVTGLAQDADGVTVEAEHEGVAVRRRAHWVVGADGGRSRVRKSIGVRFEGMTWPQRFVATNVVCDLEAHGWDPCNHLVDPADGAVIAKVTRSGIWRVTFSEDATLPLDGVVERIHAYYARVLPAGMPYELVLHSAYNMHQRVADRLRVGRVLLAGDAAHVTNPTNGFGLVSGILDSQVLSGALAAVLQGRAPDTVLDRYAEDRKRVFEEVASPSSVETKRLVFHSDDPGRLERDLQRLRAVAVDAALSRRQFMIGHRLQTPSLVAAA
ncbi:FAD-dependent monooxygenase [Luteimonas sp. BDR2-5]|uniref:FAD-dependent monooxygenase n=1 Tax=Proluteimonas luteida TaxID=2878685 RepID=UPI001E573DDB|nr:FAD-dependent monooxygenase [Luteimonas sp. BDR2-5]MCD9027976.1 FAD-dependent monooxygenase [Luteimonas sp. BDR2-5]